MFKCYEMNIDGTNYAAVHARTKKDAITKLETNAYQFKNYGSDEGFNDLPTFGEVYYKPMVDWDNKYPWRKEKYRLRHDANGNSYYE